MHKAVQVQEVQFLRRALSIRLQIGPLLIFPLGRLQRDNCRDGGADLPNLITGGRIWRKTPRE